MEPLVIYYVLNVFQLKDCARASGTRRDTWEEIQIYSSRLRGNGRDRGDASGPYRFVLGARISEFRSLRWDVRGASLRARLIASDHRKCGGRAKVVPIN